MTVPILNSTLKEIECNFKYIAERTFATVVVHQPYIFTVHSFDALAKYKATTDKLDKFLIYKAQNGGLNGGPSYVFKTSEAQLQMALDMDRDAEGILKHEVCFADGNHKRCLGYITLTLWVRINLQ